MTILWELTAALNDDLTGYTYDNAIDFRRSPFLTDGQPKQWPTRPVIKRAVLPGRKKAPIIPPIGHLTVASLILQPIAVSVLGDFLCQFGELLDVEFEGGLVYFYNVTTLIPVIDEARSRTIDEGRVILKAAFREDAIPDKPMIFKDPRTAMANIYVTNAARAWLETVLKANKLSGLSFFEAGLY
jgi:hypothetical protein